MANNHGRLGNAGRSGRYYEALVSKLIANLADHHVTWDHRKRPHTGPRLVREFCILPCRIARERDDRGDECVAPSLDVCDVAISKLAVTKCLADRGHVDAEAPLLDGHVRPDVVDQLSLSDYRTRSLGKVD